MPFEDIAAEAYYYKAVLWAVGNGITNSTSATAFSPNAECIRAQIITFLWRAQKSPAITAVNPFADISADAYYFDAVSVGSWREDHQWYFRNHLQPGG